MLQFIDIEKRVKNHVINLSFLFTLPLGTVTSIHTTMIIRNGLINLLQLISLLTFRQIVLQIQPLTGQTLLSGK